MRWAQMDLTRDEARALARLAQRGFDEIEDGDYDGRGRWSGRAECLRVLTKVRHAAYAPAWDSRQGRRSS